MPSLCSLFSSRQRRRRGKLLIVVGAGASIEFGMPSVSDVHNFLLQTSSRFFPLAADPMKNLYGYMYDTINDYWHTHVPHIRNNPNFEDVLSAIYELASAYPSGVFTGSLGAFVTINNFPEVIHINQRKPFDENILRHLGQQLHDDIVEEFRKRSQPTVNSSLSKIALLSHFLSTLAEEFDLAVVTTNYDDLIYRCLPGVETGFDPLNGRFFEDRILMRSSWPCLLHMHGSVHFDMDLVGTNLHGIVWQEDLNAQFHQNSFGRSSFRAMGGREFPTSSIIAGYGKTEQIQRLPFRTYYSELDRLVVGSDGLLFLGFSLIDSHIRQAFEDYRDGRDRRIVVIDWAADGTMLAGSDFHQSDSGPARAMRVFGVGQGEMKWLDYSHPSNVNKLKAAKDFERCIKQGRRLSIWYNGMLEACANADKILRELVN